jgi:metallo-beta-lactamase family protein
MRITLLGAAGEVTGSGYLVETDRARVLVDFGMFQGRGNGNGKNADIDPVVPGRLDAVVLTHAHLDHVGRLPLLRGLRCKVHATRPTCELAELILLDSARIQEGDAERENRWRERTGQEPDAVPLYAADDVKPVVDLFRGHAYGEDVEVASGVSIRFQDAGHILGSASVVMRVHEDGRERTVVFGGDLGQKCMPILKDPVPCPPADLVFMESTYGDRDHRPADQTLAELKGILEQAAWQKRKVLVPSFAIGRAQLLLHVLAEITRDGKTPSVPIYLDSPMAIRATEIYGKYPDEFDPEARGLARSGQMRRDLGNLHPIVTPQQSRDLNQSWDPAVVIAGSGMCEGGRIVHHLKHNLWRRGVQVLMIGFMAEGSLGRKLVEGAKSVRIFREDIVVRADVRTVGGLSAHAGQGGLLEWIAPAMAGPGPKPRVVLVHGEPRQRAALAAKVRERFGVEAGMPERLAVVEL